MESRGQRLRKLREAKGLSLEEAHQKTKIHIRVLRALEEDILSGLNPIYVKGLLKIYCSFLGVDPKDFIEDYPRARPTKIEVGSLETQKPVPPDKLQIKLAVIKKGLKLKPLIFIISLMILAIIAFALGKNISVRRAAQIKKPPSAAPISKPKIITQTKTTLPSLGIRAKEDCWLEVKVDGKTVFKNILKKGRFEAWTANQKIEFSLGNAGGVDVEVSGKLISPLGRRGQQIKNIVITKEGMMAPK